MPRGVKHSIHGIGYEVGAARKQRAGSIPLEHARTIVAEPDVYPLAPVAAAETACMTAAGQGEVSC